MDLDELTPREKDVVALVAEGLTDREIAATLGLSRNTVSNHVTIILLKLRARSRTDAAVRAVTHGIVRVEPSFRVLVA